MNVIITGSAGTYKTTMAKAIIASAGETDTLLVDDDCSGEALSEQYRERILAGALTVVVAIDINEVPVDTLCLLEQTGFRHMRISPGNCTLFDAELTEGLSKAVSADPFGPVVRQLQGEHQVMATLRAINDLVEAASGRLGPSATCMTLINQLRFALAVQTFQAVKERPRAPRQPK